VFSGTIIELLLVGAWQNLINDPCCPLALDFQALASASKAV